MTNDERLKLFQMATTRMDSLLIQYPAYLPFVSIQNQLGYLISLVTGQNQKREGLAKINIGFITMREVEARDDKIADLLYSVSSEVDKMKEGN